ncbi:hypothetical protein P3G55_26410, partial [Leptospira sp. 96542]|nr:hypothetical protein [Leptospira sp. 96542]
DDIAYAGPWARHVPVSVTHWLTDYHAAIGQWLVLGLLLLHLGAILFYLVVKKDNLITPMLQGDKLPTLTSSPSPPSRDDILTRLLALAVLLTCSALTWALTGFAA